MLRSAFRAFIRPSRCVSALLGLTIALPLAVGPAAAEWTAVTEDEELGRPEERMVVFGGLLYGVIDGSEVDATDRTLGYEGGLAMRFMGPLSLTGSVALNTVDFDGQMVQVLDRNMRADRMSAHVMGSIDALRLRAGVRLHALVHQGWRYHPYFEGGGSFCRLDATIDEIDRAAPLPFPQTPDEEPSDISTFDETQWGVYARFGVEIELAGDVGLDLGGTLEILELPAGTLTASLAGGRLYYRF